MKETAIFQSWAVSCSQGWVICWKHCGLDASTGPQAVIFSRAPGGRLFSQEPGQALSVVSETKALTFALLTRLITIYLKLIFSNSSVPYQYCEVPRILGTSLLTQLFCFNKVSLERSPSPLVHSQGSEGPFPPSSLP